MFRIFIIIFALASSIKIDAQNEIIGGCVKKNGTECGINSTCRFPMYSVMKFPQALYVADYLTQNNIGLNTEVVVRKNKLMQDTWSPMLSTFEKERAFSFAELLVLSLQQSDNNASDILFQACGGPRRVERYIRNLGFKDICIQKTEKQMHDNPALSNKNWCTPQSMVALLDWFIAHHDDNEPLRFIWKLMEECQTGIDRLPAAVPNRAKVVHKTGTGFPLLSGQPSGICDVGIVILEDGRLFPIAVFITNPSSQSRISDVAKQMLELSKEQLLQDYDYYFSQVEQIHPDPYSAFGGKEAFAKDVKQLRKELGSRDLLTLNEMQVEMTKLISRLHDGHTNVGYPEMPEEVESGWIPLKFKVTPDGLIVNLWGQDLELLKGAKLLEIEGEHVDSLLDRLDKMVITENRYGLMGKASNALRHNNTIRQLLPLFNKDSLLMKFRMVSGKDTLVTLPFYPDGPVWKTFVSSSVDNRFPKDNFEFRFADDSKQTMVMCINQIVSADVPNIENYGFKSDVIVANAFAKMLHEMKEAKSLRLIIDLRGNGGGWTMIMYAALYELYGERFLKTDMGIRSSTKVSEALLKKRGGITLEQFNQMCGTSLKMGEYYEGQSTISSFDMFMCADKGILEAQHGQPIYTPKEIYVVTDERTFSAAFHFAYMMHKMGATIVGVPSGQAPNTFMEVTPFKLPNSGLKCSVSNSLQRCFPDNDPKAKVFTPDIQLSYDDYQKYDFSKDAELLYIINRQ